MFNKLQKLKKVSLSLVKKIVFIRRNSLELILETEEIYPAIIFKHII